MRHHLPVVIVSVVLLCGLVGCDAYQRETNLSVAEKPTQDADDMNAVSAEVLVSPNNRVVYDDSEVDADALRTELRRLLDSDMGCVIVLKAHPNARTGTIIETRDLISEVGCKPKIERLPWDQPRSD